MKQIVLMVAFAINAIFCSAQTCVLSGTVKDLSIKELYLELLYGCNEYETPTHVIKVDAKGHFNEVISLPYPMFAILRSDTLQQRLLLSAGHNLHLKIDRNNPTKFVFIGKAAAENELLRNLSILNTPPFFMNAHASIPYANVTVNGWRDTIMTRVEKEIAEANALIQKEIMSSRLKKILSSEIVYAWQHNLYEFVLNKMLVARNNQRDSFFTLAMQWQPLPDSVTLQTSYFANRVLSDHCGWNIMKLAKRKEGKEVMEKRITAYLQVDRDSLVQMHKLYGDNAFNILYAKYLPAAIQDKLVFNGLLHLIHTGNIRDVRFFLQMMQQLYPGSNYLLYAQSAVQKLGNAIDQYQQQGKVRMQNTIGKRSLSDLVKPYKGKIVYLDIWGTWCGACRKELEHVPELKQRFAGKEVVFVYLSKDEDGREAYWRKVINDLQLEGEHYRMNEVAIKGIWDELQLAGANKVHSYPSYVIFDREGKIVEPNAERPSSREKLYTQLNKLL